jgi:hypothetical protein
LALEFDRVLSAGDETVIGDVTLNFHTFEKGKCVNKEESPYKPDPVVLAN